MDRGASSVVGTILMTGIVITAVTVAGVAVLDQAYGGPERAPVGAVDVATTGATVTVTYCGGEPLARDDVVLRASGTAIPFADGSLTGDGDASFEPGERWTYNGASVGGLNEDDVFVVHTPSNSVLDTAECGGVLTTPTTTTTTTPPPTTTTPTTTTTTPPPTTDDDSTPTVSLDVTLVDRSGPNDRAAYDIRYALDETDAARTASVSITIRDETTDTVMQTYTDRPATIGTHTVAYDNWGTGGDRYTVIVRAHDASGTVLDTETVTGVADGVDSDANGTVERAGSRLSWISLADRTGPSGDGVAYTLGYEAVDGVANVTMTLTPTANASGTARVTTLTSPTGNVTYTTGSAGERYVASFVARNASGDVIDRYVLQDVADGRDTHDGFDPDVRGAIRNVTLADRSTESGGTRYAVSYATASPTRRVAVAFVDREATYAIRTGTYPANGSATYSESTYGDDYTIVVAALDDDGRVLDVRTLDDTADGEDGRELGAVSRSGKPIRYLSVDDKFGGHYTVEATAGPGAARVEASVTQDGSVVKAWTNATNGFDYYGSGGERYTVTFLAYDADGDVVDVYVVTDVADGRDSAESYDTDRAVVSRVAVSDESAKQAGKKSRYRIEYDSNASRVDVVFHNPSNPYAMEAMLGLAPRGNATYPPSGSSYSTSGDKYVIVVRALNDGGEVIDVEAVQDVADGTGPPVYVS